MDVASKYHFAVAMQAGAGHAAAAYGRLGEKAVCSSTSFEPVRGQKAIEEVPEESCVGIGIWVVASDESVQVEDGDSR